jgi:predicted permease
VYAAVVLNPTSIEQPDQLVAIQASNPRANFVPTALSWVRFDNSLRHSRSFGAIAAYDVETVGFTGGDRPAEQLSAMRVSSAFFEVLRLPPHQGRFFTEKDDKENGPAVCVVSFEFWQTRLGGQPVVGRTIQLNGRSVEVIGILPPRFTAPWSARHIVLPRLFETSQVAPADIRNGASYLDVIGRLRPGVTIEQAQAELDGLAAHYAAAFAGRRDAANQTVALPFTETLVGSQRRTLGLLLAAVVAVLLVACANASTLFLGRLLARQRETAIRQGLGASRTQVVLHYLGESLTLSLAAGVAGLAIAWALLRGVTAAFGASLPEGAHFAIRGDSVAVALLVVAASALLVGLVPALYVTRPTMAPLLTFARGESTTASDSRLRAVLVLSEVALSCVLLIGAGLLLTSLLRLQQSPLGFETGGLAIAHTSLPRDKYSGEERQIAFVLEAERRLREWPGIQGAAAVFGLPLGDEFTNHIYAIAGRPIVPPSERNRAGIRIVTERYFEVIGARLTAGRGFTAEDRAGAPQVCVINDSMNRRIFDGRGIGQVILRGINANIRYEVVGVVEDIKTTGARTAPADEVFYPFRQLPWPRFALVARTTGDAEQLRKPMEAVVAELDPEQPLSGFSTMQQRLDLSWAGEQALASITMAFAAVAMFMALTGLYAVLAQNVASRTVEIGVRVALGAGRKEIVRLILTNGMAIVASGILVGMAVAAVAGRLMTAQLYAVSPGDPWIFGGVAGVFTMVGFVACLAPSWRAAALDPLESLRRV